MNAVKFFQRVDKNGPVPEHARELGSCWLWTGNTQSRGYGMFQQGQRRTLAHRASYELHAGPIPKGLEIDHLCRTPLCVNPAHLEAVTHRENMLRSPTAASAVQARKTHCDEGHPFDEVNTAYRKTPYGVGRICLTCKRARQRAYYRQRVTA